MSYKTLEVELEDGRIHPSGSETLPAKATALLTILAAAPSRPVVTPARSLGDAMRELGMSPLEKEFDALCLEWKKETYCHSSLSIQYSHPAYLRIIGMGREGLPYVLKDLQKSPARWFYALKYMAGKDIAHGIKSFEEARNKWLEWGRTNKYLS